MELAETQWLDRVAKRDGLPTAIVAAVNLTRPDLDEVLEAQAASLRLRGVRHIVGREPADDARTGCARVLDDPALVRGLRSLAASGLSFDLQLTVPQMARVADLLARVPDLPVALCHCGSPWDQTPKGLEAWRRGLEHLAQLPRLVCKLSGLSMFDPRRTTEEFVARVRAVLHIFGPERCLFGSNFPVDGLHRSYGEIVAATRAALQGFDAAASEWVFRETARRFYRL
jgi:predicted TIM-barrel fold metal-dependent hydrolase